MGAVHCYSYDELLHIYNDKGVYVYGADGYINTIHNIKILELQHMKTSDFNDFLVDCKIKTSLARYLEEDLEKFNN